MRALVLAAGLGTRLRPLTEKTPKPLLPVVARPLIENAFALLHDAGVRDLAVNAHHLAEQVESFCGGGTRFGQNVTLSIERPDVLGTGGAIKRLQSFLEKSDPFLVLNGDTLSKPDLAAAVTRHRATGALATMILRRDERASRFGLVETDMEGRVVNVSGLTGRTGTDGGLFIGTHILSPEIFRYMPPEHIFCIIRQVYLPLLARKPGAVRAFFTDAPFFDLGTPEDFQGAQFALLRSLSETFPAAFFGLTKKAPGVFVSPAALVHPDAVLTPPCAVCDGASIGAGAHVGPDAVIGAAAIVSASSRIEHAILLPGMKH